MSCYYCSAGDYWVCDSFQPPECDRREVIDPPWHYAWTQTIPEDTFKVWYRDGCDAKLAKDQPNGPGNWHDVGTIDSSLSGAGDYRLSCRAMGATRYEVLAEKL